MRTLTNNFRAALATLASCTALGVLLPIHKAQAEMDKGTVAFEAAYTSEFWANTTGGLDTGSVWLSNFNLTLEAELGAGTLFIYGLHNNNTVLSETLVGDVQTVSNIDNSKTLRLYELWYSHPLFAEQASVKFGLIDLNADFDAVDTASWFINSTHGIEPTFSQTGENGPSIFPNTSLALTAAYNFADAWTLQAGVFDAIPNDPEHPRKLDLSLGGGALLTSELAYSSNENLRVGMGVWSYTAEFALQAADDTDALADNNRGSYVFIDGTLLGNAEGGPRVKGWMRHGRANNTDINYLKSSLAGGLVFSNFIAARPDDVFGIAVASAGIGERAKLLHQLDNEAVHNNETNVELFYHARINDWFALTPDVQYIIHPGIAGTLDNALVFGLRFEVQHSGFLR